MPNLKDLPGDIESPAVSKPNSDKKNKSGKNRKQRSDSKTERNNPPTIAPVDVSGPVLLPASSLRGKMLQDLIAKCDQHPLLWIESGEDTESKLDSLLRKALKKQTTRDDKPKWVRRFAELVEEGYFSELSTQSIADARELLAGVWLLGHATRSRPNSNQAEGWRQRLLDDIVAILDNESSVSQEDPLLWMLTQVEIPVALSAIMSSDPSTVQRMAGPAAKRLEEWFEQKVDEEGCLPGRFANSIGSVTLSVLRSANLLAALKMELSSRAAGQLDWMIRQLMLATGAKSRVAFSEGRMRLDAGLARLLIHSSPDKSDHRLIRHKFGIEKSKPGRLPDFCHYSEAQGYGILRSGWDRAARIGVACDGQDVEIEFGGKKMLVRGKLETLWSVNGKPVVWDDPAWTLNCWHEDKDVQYLELELKNEQGLTFQRQIMLLVQDEMMLLGDALMGTAKNRLDYQLSIPMASGITAQQETDTREIYLRSERIESLALPLTMGEWQYDHTDNRFTAHENAIQMNQSSMGRSMYAAIAFDLKPGRSIQPRTWRQLSVGENLETVPPDIATAARFLVGRDHWVCYRNLAAIGNRTFMGCNVYHDFYIGRFDKEGMHQPQLMIEP